jgi:hypothetical protein
MKLISLVLWSPLMTDDFKTLVLKTGKGKPKWCLEVLCVANATSNNMEVNSGLRGEKLDNNRLSTDNHWLCGISETSKLVCPVTNTGITPFKYAPRHRSVRGVEVWLQALTAALDSGK